MFFTRISFLLFSVIFSYQQTFTQGNSEDSRIASPRIGWDTLREELYFQVISGRTDTKGPYDVHLEIGPGGNVDVLSFNDVVRDNYQPREYLDSLLIDHIRSVLGSAIWNPAIEKNKPVNSHLDITILFRGAKAYLMYDQEDRLLHAETPIDRIRNTTLIK